MKLGIPFRLGAENMRMESHDQKVAHLLRRTGFTVTQKHIDTLRKASIPEIVDTLLEKSDGSTQPIPDLPTDPKEKGKAQKSLQKWWLETMRLTTSPLVEKMTLFWHNHFTSGFDKVKPAYMLKQNQLLRRHAIGNLRELLNDISVDPAMMIYLDNTYNHKKAPNENFARELVELFTLGIGHYTEKDIKEIARSFTGWKFDAKADKVLFEDKQHDIGQKTIFGKTGNYGLKEVIDLILEKPECPIFITTKLWNAFAYPHPDSSVIDPIAKLFVDSYFDIKVLLKAMFTSEAFYSDQAYRSIIKSPADYVLGLLVLFPKLEVNDSLLNSMQMMGQQLFAPPNVAGWPGGETWLDSSKLLTRINWVDRMVETLSIQDVPVQGKKAEDDVNMIIHTLGLTDLSDGSRKQMLDYATQTKDIPTRMKGLVYLAYASPEAQLS